MAEWAAQTGYWARGGDGDDMYDAYMEALYETAEAQELARTPKDRAKVKGKAGSRRKKRKGSSVKILCEFADLDSRRAGTKGMIGSIIEDDGSGTPYCVKLPNGQQAWYAEEWVEILDSVAEESHGHRQVEDRNQKCSVDGYTTCGDAECNNREGKGSGGGKSTAKGKKALQFHVKGKATSKGGGQQQSDIQTDGSCNVRSQSDKKGHSKGERAGAQEAGSFNSIGRSHAKGRGKGQRRAEIRRQAQARRLQE